MSAEILIQGAQIFDPAGKSAKTGDLRIADGKIVECGAKLAASGADAIDATGCWLFPGLIDMHVHLREPGQENTETIATGTRAAAAGGYTSVVAMPNTTPTVDDKTGVEYVTRTAQTHGKVHVYQAGAISRNLAGEEMADMGEMAVAGAVAFTDDDCCIANAMLMRRAMQYSTLFDLPIIAHCEDADLSEDGSINDGLMSTVTGLPGLLRESEIVDVARNCILAQQTGARLHIAHVSCAESVDLIRFYKEKNVQITAETAAHYLLLNETAVDDFKTNAKILPPLRTEEDRKTIVEALRDGTIDVIASDHGPQTPGQKDQEFDRTPFGVIGLETTLPLVLTHLVEGEGFEVLDLIRRMTTAPARILRLNAGTLSAGAPGDVTLWSPEGSSTIETGQFYSKSCNTPFEGWKVNGRVAATIVEGRVVHACPHGPAAKYCGAE